MWIRFDSVSGTADVETFHELTVTIEDLGNMNISDICWNIMESSEYRSGLFYPRDIVVSGKGIIINETGDSEYFENVMSVEACMTSYYSVTINTYSDAWLPFTIKAEPQKDVWKHNAYRLEKALQEIEEKVPLELDEEDYGDFVSYDGYLLDNLRDDDGDVVALNEFGRCI